MGYAVLKPGLREGEIIRGVVYTRTSWRGALHGYFISREKRVDSSTRLTSARLDLSVCRVKVPAGVIPGS